jgi:hypothetical protein
MAMFTNLRLVSATSLSNLYPTFLLIDIFVLMVPLLCIARTRSAAACFGNGKHDEGGIGTMWSYLAVRAVDEGQRP